MGQVAFDKDHRTLPAAAPRAIVLPSYRTGPEASTPRDRASLRTGNAVNGPNSHEFGYQNPSRRSRTGRIVEQQPLSRSDRSFSVAIHGMEEE